jgi:hypothetical protein
MEELGMQAGQMPMWVNVFIGIAAALGGFEFIKWIVGLIVNWRARRRKESAEAKEADAVAHQQVAAAGQQDADWRQKELELMTAFVQTAKEQYEDLTRRYDELKAEKNEDRKIKQELRLKMTEHERKIDGLQRAFTESESRRIAAERLYCSVESCTKRHPPMGTYDSTKAAPRRKNGQFAPRKVASDAN